MNEINLTHSSDDSAHEGEAGPLPPSKLTHQLARLVLAAFVFTFLISRILVILIMERKIPDMFLHVGHTHVHHLNYGIFLLSIVGYFLIFVRPTGRAMAGAAVIYGIGLGMTFDEFGMWIHLGGGYWQRASFDAVVVVSSVLALIAYAPDLRKFHPRHWTTAIVLVVVLTVFGVLLVRSVREMGNRYLPRLVEIEDTGPK